MGLTIPSIGNMPGTFTDSSGGAGNGLGGLLEGFNKFEEAKRSRKDRTEADTERKRQVAMQKMPMLERAAMANPSDTATIKALQDARKDAGLPPATMAAEKAALKTTPGFNGAASKPQGNMAVSNNPNIGIGDDGTGLGKSQASPYAPPPQTPQMPDGGADTPLNGGQPSLDLAQFRSQKNELTTNDYSYYMALDPHARTAFESQYSPGVFNDDMRSAPQQLVPGSPAERQIASEYDRQYHLATTGQMDPGQFISWLNTRGKQLKLAGIDVDYAKQDRAVLDGLGAKVKAEISQMESRGIHFREADKIAIQRANSIEDLDKARIKLMGIQGKSLDDRTRGQLQHWKAADGIAERRAAAYSQRVQVLNQQAQSGDKAAIANLRGLAGLMTGEAKTTQSQVDNLVGTRQRALDNGADVNDPEIKKLGEDIDGLKQRQSQMQTQADSINQQYAGKIGMQAAMQMSGLPLPQKLSSVSFGGFSPTQKVRSANNGALLQMPDGKLYNKDGSLSSVQP